MIDFSDKEKRNALLILAGAVFIACLVGLVHVIGFNSVSYSRQLDGTISEVGEHLNASLEQAFPVEDSWPAILDTKGYDERLLKLANIRTSSTTKMTYSDTTNVIVEGKPWPTAAPYPNGGAILPFKRILAYYGNFYSRYMGVLGEYPEDQVIAKLMQEKARWEAADPDTPVLPAIHYIAIVAQADPGTYGLYKAAMPDSEIDKAYALAKKVEGILILDVQVGKSTIQAELPQFKTYLERPEVHFAIDPEFSMKTGDAPGEVVGTYNENDVNYVIDYLSEIVKEKKLPPKVLVVHRFTKNMVTGYSEIRPTPEVQVVMDMDGWGPPANKIGTYNQFIAPEPVQFTGLKIFYKNDLKPPSTGLLTPAQVLELTPKPVYIQYQ